MTTVPSAGLSTQADTQYPLVSHGRPIVFDGLSGMYHAAPGATAVLFLNPWGYEELCSRKTYRLLAEALAAGEYPCLRFDFPGNGHSAGTSCDIGDETALRQAADKALDQLIALCAPSRIIVIGQGLGGLLAGDLAQRRTIDGLVLLGPVSQGGRHLRELSAWTMMTQPTFFVLPSDGPDGGLMAGGFLMSAATTSEIKALNLLKADGIKAQRVLLMERPDDPGDAKLGAHLAALGDHFERRPFEGYADYVSNPTLSVVPSKAIDDIISWASEHFPFFPAAPFAAPVPMPAALETAVYYEQLFRFGPDDMFFGALTAPPDRTAELTLLILNSGYDHCAGWGRSTVELARALASEGFAVMRMDLAGIGETPLWPGQPAQVLYSLRQNDDVACALDWLETRTDVGKIALVGRCSGAYPAFVSAASDPRVAGTFLINARKLAWDPKDDVGKAIQEPIQTLQTYGGKITDPKQIRRVLSGELPLSRVLQRLTSAVLSKVDRTLAPWIGGLSKQGRLNRAVHARMKALEERNALLTLVYSVGDQGLDEFRSWFGDHGRKLSAYPGSTLILVPDADHNMTPMPARATVQRELLEFARILSIHP